MQRITDGDPEIGVNVINELMIEVENETTKHSVSGAAFLTGKWTKADYFLSVTSFTESGAANPVTVDVVIQTYDPGTDMWITTQTFTQVVCAAGGSETAQEVKGLSSSIGIKQRVVYITAGTGTISDLDFKVGVVYKR